MAADHLFHQALVGEVIEPALVAIALPGGIDQREIARLARARPFHVA
jgi:hypothetical protein